MLDLKEQTTDPKLLSPVALAFIGDGVFELLVRERLLSHGTIPAAKLHSMSVDRVNAASQSRAYLALEPVLTKEEEDILKRGRNANTSRVPKSSTQADYRRATAVEALFGYLYLKGELQRIGELYTLIETVFETG